jgi:hypothetical protein
MIINSESFYDIGNVVVNTRILLSLDTPEDGMLWKSIGRINHLFVKACAVLDSTVRIEFISTLVSPDFSINISVS